MGRELSKQQINKKSMRKRLMNRDDMSTDTIFKAIPVGLAAGMRN